MFSLYKRDGVWWCQDCHDGKQRRWSLHTRDGITARALLRQIEIDGLTSSKTKRKSWPEFEDEFLRWIESQVRPTTLRGYTYSVGHFGKFMATRSSNLLADLEPSDITAFTESRRKDMHPSWKRNVTSGGVKFDLRVLHRAFSYAVDCKYITANPVRIRNLNSDAGKTLPFSEAELAKMFADPLLQDNPQLRAILLTFLYTGLRISDVISLTKASVAGDTLIRRTIKRGKVVTLPLYPQLREAIEVHLKAQNAAQRATELLYATETGRTLLNLDKMLRRLWKRCGVAGGHAHRFRDTFAVRLLAKGASLYDVSKLMGISMQTADRHYAPYVKELQERGARMIQLLDSV